MPKREINVAKVALLGVKGGPAIRPGSSMPTSTLLQMGGRIFLVDAGLGVSAGVIAQGIGLHEIEVIFITHLHSDHYLELGPLLHTAWTAGLKRKVTVIGPAGLKRYFDGFWDSMADDIELRIADEGRPDLRQMIDLRLLTEGEVQGIDGLSVSTLRNQHPPIVDSYALRFEADGTVVVFSGDTAFMDEMSVFAKDADLLVHEAMLMRGVDALCARVGNGDDRLKTHLLRSHCPAAQTGVIAREAGVGILALNHLVPGDDPSFSAADWKAEVASEWQGDVRIGTDGMVIAL